ncbi:hypothetical protein BOX15_Mlig005561g2 [Macrostomum lignano]|uniref:Tetraspanin n=1 Tax=Macrostomum lignano TaxID=282301 RepID=A0A267GRI2_9PLAT|nr:hypothetical protein BOX15_Mlig005561g1 [Macrostomum lignano]PAA87899.1 hypothetical protein BOX15_Mlig005561g2 [Macrostomum lignano]
MGACGCCTSQIAACILYIVNSLLITVGILLGIVGCLLHFGGSAIYQLFSGLLSSLASSNVGGSNVQLSIADVQKILGSWSTVVSYAGIVLLGIGAFILASSILGCVGACCKLKVVLIVYVVLVLALTLALLGFVIGYLLFKQDMRSIGAKEMKRLITEQYQGSQSSSQNDFSKVLDIIQGRLECCGIDNFTDFYSASQWNRTYYLSSESRYVTLVAPLSCCQLSMTTFEPVDKNCTYNPTPSNSNYMKSCYGKLWDILTTYANVVMTGMAITAAITGCIAALAIIMLCYHIKNDVTPI